MLVVVPLFIKAVTGAPVKFIGVGEKIDNLDAFDPKRVVGKILGMGDIVALVKQVQDNVDQAEMEKMAKKMRKGAFDLNDVYKQFEQLQNMGGIQSLLDKLLARSCHLKLLQL